MRERKGGGGQREIKVGSHFAALFPYMVHSTRLYKRNGNLDYFHTIVHRRWPTSFLLIPRCWALWWHSTFQRLMEKKLRVYICHCNNCHIDRCSLVGWHQEKTPPPRGWFCPPPWGSRPSCGGQRRRRWSPSWRWRCHGRKGYEEAAERIKAKHQQTCPRLPG